MSQSGETGVESAQDLPLGLRLRRAREAAGLSVAAVAESLHMPSRIVEAMEREDVEQLGASIYVRGNYASYARLLDVPSTLVDSFCRNRSSQPQVLAPNVHVPRSRVLFDRYVKRSVYVVLTASIVPSVIWLASLDRSTAKVQTLLETPAQQVITIQPREAEQESEPDLRESADAAPLYPVKASMTPSYSLGNAVAEAEPSVAPLDASPASDEVFLALRFRQDSWFEVLAADGHRLESGILRVGDERRFPRSQVGKVSIGNAGGVDVILNGKQLDLTPFRRANVARFALSSAGSVSPIEG